MRGLGNVALAGSERCTGDGFGDENDRRTLSCSSNTEGEALEDDGEDKDEDDDDEVDVVEDAGEGGSTGDAGESSGTATSGVLEAEGTYDEPPVLGLCSAALLTRNSGFGLGIGLDLASFSDSFRKTGEGDRACGALRSRRRACIWCSVLSAIFTLISSSHVTSAEESPR